MASSIDDIVLSRHNIEIAILIPEARVSGIVVPRHRTKVFLNIFVVVIQNCVHEGRWQGLFDVDSPHLPLLALNSSLGVYDPDIEAWHRFAG